MNDVTLRETLQDVLTKLEQIQPLLQTTPPTEERTLPAEMLLDATIEDIRKALGITKWPDPTVDPPDMETLQEWFFDSICEATDGCIVEHDGRCPHNHPSWFLRLGLI